MDPQEFRRIIRTSSISKFQPYHKHQVLWKGFPTDSRHSNGYTLCPCPSRHFSVLIWSGLHTLSLCSELERKSWHLSSTSDKDTSMTYYQSITQILRIIWVRYIPLNLRSKSRQRATPVLPTWIYSCRSEGMVSCALSFMTNVTILTSISQTFRFRAATFHLRQPMAFYLTAHTVCQGLPFLWMFYSKGETTFI